VKRAGTHLLLTAGALIMLYPLLWMISGSLKPTDEIFGGAGLRPHRVTWTTTRHRHHRPPRLTGPPIGRWRPGRFG
jgi:ABC-type glycerol-3-phosphate transport system permease component